MTKKLHIVSLGCNKNLVDTEVMLGRLREYEITPEVGEADLVIVNTCGFIGPAKEESIRTTLELHAHRKKGSLLVMAGCLSERYRDELAQELPEVDIIAGVGDYARIDELIEGRRNATHGEVFLIGDEERVITGSTSHAYIKIAEGCNQTCSFCAIPGFKGKLHSRSLESIVKEITRLKEQGFYDFSLIAQDSSSWGRDIGIKDGLLTLIDAIEAIGGIRARILYLYPTTVTKKLIARIAQSSVFLPYFDIPIQHIHDGMLKKMKRGMGRTKTVELLETMRAIPGSFVRTGIIVGHPGESEEAFEELVRFIENFGFDRLSVFAYSDEEGTPAYEMKDKIDPKEIRRRLKIIEKSVAKLHRNNAKKMVGQKILATLTGVSDEGDYFWEAKALLWAPEIDGKILINDSEVDAPETGRLYEVEITSHAGQTLLATLLRPATLS
ncbi:MAG: 30S ribosomal protein S12 methylthiotransferase RimO [Campylobacterales bacterium]